MGFLDLIHWCKKEKIKEREKERVRIWAPYCALCAEKLSTPYKSCRYDRNTCYRVYYHEKCLVDVLCNPENYEKSYLKRVILIKELEKEEEEEIEKLRESCKSYCVEK